MKNKISYNLLVILSLSILTSCEEVIVLDLDSTEPRIVIEANVNASDSTCEVKMSKTKDFYTTNDFEKVTDAVISLQNKQGTTYNLSDDGDGVYTAQQLALAVGDTLVITITTADNEVFTSTAIVPTPAVLNPLSYTQSIGGGGPGGGGPGSADTTYIVNTAWLDIAGIENYYRIKVYKNGNYKSNFYGLTDDRMGDGELIARPLIRLNFKKNDQVTVKLLSVNKGYYDYFTQLSNAGGRGFGAATPFNPQGNLGTVALGYFGVYYESVRTINIW